MLLKQSLKMLSCGDCLYQLTYLQLSQSARYFLSTITAKASGSTVTAFTQVPSVTPLPLITVPGTLSYLNYPGTLGCRLYL